MQYDAFISYRHADGDAARGVAKLLRAFNLKVFIDDAIAAGNEWAPEIWAALDISNTLMVLWSRSAAQSPFVHEEWTRAPATSKVFALALDGQALPPELGKFNAITGLDVAGRLLARSVELMKSEKLSPAKAQEQLLNELAKDGVVLEEKQKRALAVFLPLVAVASWWLPSWLSSAGLLSAGVAASFAVGYWVAPIYLGCTAQAANLPANPKPALPSSAVTGVAPATAATPATVSTPAAARAYAAPVPATDCSQQLTLAQKDCARELGTCTQAKTKSEADASASAINLKRCQSAAANATTKGIRPVAPGNALLVDRAVAPIAGAGAAQR
jgi:TIR domain